MHGVITDASPHIYDIGGDSHAVPCFVAPTIELSELYLVIVDFPYTLHILWIAVGIFVITRV